MSQKRIVNLIKYIAETNDEAEQKKLRKKLIMTVYNDKYFDLKLFPTGRRKK